MTPARLGLHTYSAESSDHHFLHSMLIASYGPFPDRRACPTICGEPMRVLVVFDLVDQRRAPLPRLPLGIMRR